MIRVGAVGLTVGACALAAPAGASAAVRDCDVHVVVDNKVFANSGVTSVRNMSCRAARRSIRRNATTPTRAAYGEAGSRFRVGRWSCVVYVHDYELWRARCSRGSRAYRVDYGY